MLETISFDADDVPMLRVLIITNNHALVNIRLKLKMLAELEIINNINLSIANLNLPQLERFNLNGSNRKVNGLIKIINFDA